MEQCGLGLGPVKGEYTAEAVSARAWHSLWLLGSCPSVVCGFLLWLSLVERKPMATWQKEGLLAGSEAMGNEAHSKVGHGAREARGLVPGRDFTAFQSLGCGVRE